MKEIKDTVRSHVRIGYDGRVHKTFKGTHARERYFNEIRVLEHLKEQKCDFVPRVLERDDESLYLVTTNCGQRVTRMSEEKSQSIFEALEQYGVRHDDPFVRNITYDPRRGMFCVIDFELAELIERPGES